MRTSTNLPHHTTRYLTLFYHTSPYHALNLVLTLPYPSLTYYSASYYHTISSLSLHSLISPSLILSDHPLFDLTLPCLTIFYGTESYLTAPHLTSPVLSGIVSASASTLQINGSTALYKYNIKIEQENKGSKFIFIACVARVNLLVGCCVFSTAGVVYAARKVHVATYEGIDSG